MNEGWNNEYYLYMIDLLRKNIRVGEEKKYFKLYDKMIEKEEYECAKAIRDVMEEMAEAINKTNHLLD